MTDPKQFRTLTRSAAVRAKKQAERGFAFPLPFTSGTDDEGNALAVARVRKFPLSSLVNEVGLTASMQETVLEVVRRIQRGEGFSVDTWSDFVGNQRRQEELANGLCVIGFLEPRLVHTQDEAALSSDESVLWVEDIDIRDRLNFLTRIMAPESEAAKAMAPFPETGLGGAVAGEGSEVAASPFGPPADAGGGVRPPELSVL